MKAILVIRHTFQKIASISFLIFFASVCVVVIMFLIELMIYGDVIE